MGSGTRGNSAPYASTCIKLLAKLQCMYSCVSWRGSLCLRLRPGLSTCPNSSGWSRMSSSPSDRNEFGCALGLWTHSAFLCRSSLWSFQTSCPVVFMARWEHRGGRGKRSVCESDSVLSVSCTPLLWVLGWSFSNISQSLGSLAPNRVHVGPRNFSFTFPALCGPSSGGCLLVSWSC